MSACWSAGYSNLKPAASILLLDTLFPPKIIDELKRRVLTGYFPGVDEIVREAKHGQPLRAQQALLRTFQEDAWRMRSE